jgi:hypothetical protein
VIWIYWRAGIYLHLLVVRHARLFGLCPILPALASHSSFHRIPLILLYLTPIEATRAPT